jgi:histidinol-phosphate aminotransferase
MKPPYNISTINQQTVSAKLENLESYKKEVTEIIKERKRLSGLLANIAIVEKVYPSDANFLLVKVKNANAVYNDLIERNIVVRNRSSLVNNCLRITVGKKSENDLLIKALKNISI